MSWADERMIALDLETTSADPEEARIVTGCIAWVGGDAETETMSLLADPGVEIPAGATAVHGVTTGHAREHGKPAELVTIALLSAIDGRARGVPVVGMNLRYDLTVLAREAERHGLVGLRDSPESPLLVVDVRVIDLWLDKYRPGKRTLADLSREYGVRLDGAHDAASDAIAAARIAWWIGHEVDVFRRGRGRHEIRELLALRREWDRVRADLPALHEAQQRWAAEQAEDLERHFREHGNLEHVAREWPIVPRRVTV